MTALAVTSQFVDRAKISYFSRKVVTFVPSKLGAPGICGSSMRSAPRASIASSSMIRVASIVAVSVSSVSSPVVVYRRPLPLSVVACRLCCAPVIVCAPRLLSLCLLTVLCSAFRLKIRLRAPFVVK